MPRNSTVHAIDPAVHDTALPSRAVSVCIAPEISSTKQSKTAQTKRVLGNVRARMP